MCRMIASIGEELRLDALTDQQPHGLLRQSFAARELQTAVVCADGWGAAWYLPGHEPPLVYRSTSPIWADPNRAPLGLALRSRCWLTAVRSATDSLSVAHANTQPFAQGRLAFVHNGFIHDFDNALAKALTASLSTETTRAIRGTTDSEHVLAVIYDEYAQLDAAEPGPRLVDAVRRALARLGALLREHRTFGLLTFIVGDGERLVCVRWASEGSAPSLYLGHVAEESVRTQVAASEPLDDTGHFCAVREGEVLWLEPGREPQGFSL